MPEILEQCYLSALGAMAAGGPKPLLTRAQFEAAERGTRADVSLQALASFLSSAELNNTLRKQLHVAISRWDIADPDPAWTGDTVARSPERRSLIYNRLGVVDVPPVVGTFDDVFPLLSEMPVVISDKFEPWYTPERRQQLNFYWRAYADLLGKKGWTADALAGLDEATTRVVERLTDPLREEIRQAKGLVVGYVQSGKTANFTGVVAKAIDAGYRLIVVLTGTIDVLRKQTQRRVDMELVGKENIVRGVDPLDPAMMAQVDYQDDPDWDEKFLSFGFLPSSSNYPDIIRLTTREFDYKSLRAGIVALEFEKVDKSKPLYAPENLPSSCARIVIVKKNKTVLEKLVKDLKRIKTARQEIPALIIDDESDQASVNTSNPKKWAAGRPLKTAINKCISELLGLIPRTQYVGYTATPFANVFIDPSDTADIFPKDFLISLERPVGYMGVRDFHDIDDNVEPEQRTFANSNEKAYVRDLRGGEEHDSKLQESIDAFVLSGALKLYRTSVNGISFRHHTMLVHASVKQIEHGELAKTIRGLWRNSGYSNPSGLARLRALYLADFLPVSRARAGQFAVPKDFEELMPHIAKVISKVTVSQDPVMVVNGDKEMASEEVDFDKREVWRILVGGTKLSRGFTVEGLTVSYYRRKTKQADTLMQMGRWFGFRRGYEDLVRLYIGRAEPDGESTLDLYEAFEAIVRDEEAFRDQLRQYAELVNGHPQITPKDIPPLVSQHLPWLKPAARNKMFNAELVVRRTPGSLVIPTGYPTDGETKERNYQSVQPLLAAASRKVRLRVPALPNVEPSKFDAWIGQVGSEVLLKAIVGIRWISPDYYAPDKAFLREIADGVETWVVIAPQTDAEHNVRTLPGIGDRIVFKRGLKPPQNKLWGEPTDRKHRPAAQFLAGSMADYGDEVLQPLKGPKVGAILIYPMATDPASLPAAPEPKDIVLAVAWIAPASLKIQASEVVQFRAKNSALADEPIVPAE
jgi:Z1 domain-containing protein